MSTLMRQERPSLADLFWSGWPIGAMTIGPPEQDLMPMRVEEFADGDTWVIRAELPGVDPDKDVEVSLHGGVLTVTAERREETQEGEEGKPGYRLGVPVRVVPPQPASSCRGHPRRRDGDVHGRDPRGPRAAVQRAPGAGQGPGDPDVAAS